MITMLFDHFGTVFGFSGWGVESLNNITEYSRLIGRSAFPLFAFALTEGWIHTHDKTRYFSRLCLWATISEVPFAMAFYTGNYQTGSSNSAFQFMPVFLILAVFAGIIYWLFVLRKKIDKSLICLVAVMALPAFSLKIAGTWIIVSDELNVLYTFILGIAVLYLADSIADKNKSFLQTALLTACTGICLIAYGMNADYGIGCMGVILILVLYLIRKYDVFHEKLKYIQGITIFLWGMIFYGVMLHNWINGLFTLIPAILIMFYNQKAGTVSTILKRSFYAIYPFHLLILGILNVLIKNTR